MKKSLFIFCFFLLCACSEQAGNSQNVSSNESFTEQEYFYSSDNIVEECEINGSDVACAVEAAVKCILKPTLNICANSGLPDFIFMEDEALQRPTEQSFEITKLKPLPDGSLEVYTKGICNGNMFGLCNGNIIYVLKNMDNKWKVYDIYAVE